MPDRSFYLTKAKELCKAFSNGSSPTTISSFFTTEGIVYEHGPNNISTLPFLGKEFKGVKSIIEYFEMIGKYLKITDEMMFNDWTIDLFPEDVDVEKVKAVITTRGKATFEYTSTGKRWVACNLYIGMTS